MNDSQSFLAIIGAASLVAFLFLLSLEIWEQRSKRQAREQAAVQAAFERGYQGGYEEAACRAYTFTDASRHYQDWQAFRDDLDRLGD